MSRLMPPMECQQGNIRHYPGACLLSLEPVVLCHSIGTIPCHNTYIMAIKITENYD
jgi:hypothetical protein